jgi:succinate dehydrogenase / fumarate reductase cytochrome b subunit
MAHPGAKAARPLSPHLTVWRPTITYVMSIVHRITGGVLYFGMILLAWWLLAAATGPEAFALANGFFGSWFGLLILLGFTWAFLHHLLGGIRHLVWDTGAGYSKTVRNGMAWATIVGSLVLTIVVFGAGLMVR